MTRILLFLALLASGCAAAPPDQDLLGKALLRRGGEKAVRAASGVIRTTSGTLRGIPYRSTLTYRDPNMLRYQLEFVGLDMKLERVFDGRFAYQNAEAGAVKLPPTESRAVRSLAMDETVFWLVGLQDPNLTVASEEPRTFRGVPVDTLRVGHWTGFSRLLFFDRESQDLIGTAGMKWLDSGRKATEVLYSDYQEVEGVRVPMRFEMFVDGELFMDGRHEQITFLGVPPADSFYLEKQIRAEPTAEPLPGGR